MWDWDPPVPVGQNPLLDMQYCYGTQLILIY